MPENLIEVARVDTPQQAERVVDLLREAGLPAFISGATLAGVFTGLLPLGPQIKVFAHPADLKCALDVLSTLGDAQAPDGWEDDDAIDEGVWHCPTCDDAVPDDAAACPACRTPRPRDAAD